MPVLLAGLLVTQASGANASSQAALVDFLAPRGCVVGPATRALAADAGFAAETVETLTARADGEAGTIRTGDWIVLPASLCRIRPPEVRSEIRLGDAEVVALTSRIDAYAELGDRGCFIDGPAVMERVQETRGWHREKASLEYFRFLAENLRSRDLGFYKDDPLSTPAGFQILTDACAEVPSIDDIRRSQALRDQEFDALIRADAPNVACERDSGPSYRFMDLVKARTSGDRINAWMFFEVQMMAIGGGWYAGTSATRMGRPRPPLCRFE